VGVFFEESISPHNGGVVMNSSATGALLRRRVDAFEAVHILFSRRFGCNVSAIVRFNRHIPFNLLREGVRLVEKKHFLLRCGISLNPLAFVETENVAEVSLIEKCDDEDWQSLASTELYKPFNYEEGPLFRLSYLAGENFNELVLSMSHSVGDAYSGLIVLSEICEYALHDKPPNIEGGRMVTDISVEKLVLSQLGCAEKKSWEKRHTEYSNLTEQMAEVGVKEDNSTIFVYRSLDKSVFQTFFRKKREKKLSFQSLFSAIILKEYVHFVGMTGGVHYTCPINVRPFIEKGSGSLGCKITLLELFLDKIYTLSYDDLASFINVKMTHLLRDRGGLLQNLFNLLSMNRTTCHGLPYLGVSSVGWLRSINHLSTEGLCAIYLNANLGNKFTLHPIVCVLKDRMYVTFCFARKLWTGAEAQTFSDRIVNRIEQF